MTTGQMYRFRMVNACGSDTLEVYIVTEAGAATTACTIREIAIDGVYLDAPRAMHDSQSFLVPAARVDWMVKCDTAGIYYLNSFNNSVHVLSIGGISRFKGNLVKLTVSGAAVAPVQTFPTTLPSRPGYMKDLRNVADADVGGRFVIELNPRTYLNRETWSSGDYYRYKMKVDTIQEWNLLNTDTSTSHPLHIHVNHFQIISYNTYTGGFGNRTEDGWELIDIDDQTTPCLFQHAGATADRSTASEEKFAIIPESELETEELAAADPLQYLGHDTRFTADAGNTLGYSRLGDWRDVVLVPPLANITIRFNAHEHVGDVIIHCHILAHEDTGMIMVVDVVPEGESLDANTTSGDAYPGSCRACDRYPFNNLTTLGTCETNTTTSGKQGIFETCSIGVLVLFTALSVFSTLK